MRTITIGLLALLSLPAHAPLARADVSKQLTELKDTAYGNYWDRKKALEELSQMNDVEAAKAIATVLGDPHDSIRELSAQALGAMTNAGARQHVREVVLLTDKNGLARAGAAWAIRVSKDKEAGPFLMRSLMDRDPNVRVQAVRAIVAIDYRDATKVLIKLLGMRPAEVPAEAARALAAFDAKDAYAKLAKLASSGRGVGAGEAAAAIGKLDPEQAPAVLLKKSLKSRSYEVRMGALFGLAASGDKDAGFEGGSVGIKDKDWRVRHAAIETLVSVRQARVLGPLIDQLANEKGRLRYDIGMALQGLTGRDFGFTAIAWKNWYAANKDREDIIVPADSAKSKKPTGGGTVADYFGIPIYSNAVMFSIDFSGSMKDPVKIVVARKKKQGSVDTVEEEESDSKRKIDHAFDELERALATFQREQKFGVVMMSTEAAKTRKTRMIGPRLLPALPSNALKGLNHVRGTWEKLELIKRGRGDMWTTMVEAAAVPEVDTIFILSDGRPTDGAFTVEENVVREWARFNRFRRIMIHTLHIGESRGGRDLMRDLAESTGGIALALVKR